jgi:cyclic dehypoxanthinyl futalosine synthase
MSQRSNREQALYLLQRAPLGELMEQAHQVRMQRHPQGLVTFVYDTNPNYSNVCVTCCRFCAFWREAGDPDAYTLSPEQLAGRVAAAAARGATTVLLQGGHNPDIGLAEWLAYIRAIRAACPELHIHPFSPPEIRFVAEREQMTVREVLATLRAEGIRTLPGGGAEVLCDQVREQISPRKCSSEAWLEVMAEAHDLGFRSTATLMYGHLESDHDLVEHLDRLRRLQDRTGGFHSFIPWSFKPGGSRLSETVTRIAHPARYVRIIAVARLYLDCFEHIQSSWFSESITAGQLGLLAGADDFGGLLVEENVLRETGYRRATTLAELLSIIRSAGFTPARRSSDYEIIEHFPAAARDERP